MKQQRDIENLIWLLNKGHFIPFLGAGASLTGNNTSKKSTKNSFPTGKKLANHFYEKMRMLKEWTNSEDELDINNLILMASYYEYFYGRTLLKIEL